MTFGDYMVFQAWHVYYGTQWGKNLFVDLINCKPNYQHTQLAFL